MGGIIKEKEELKLCDLVIVISKDEIEKLNVRGVKNTGLSEILKALAHSFYYQLSHRSYP